MRAWKATGVLASIAVVLLLVLTGFAVAVWTVRAPADAAGRLAAGALPFANLPNAPAAIRDLHPPAALTPEEQTLVANATTDARAGMAPTLNDLFAAIRALYPNDTLLQKYAAAANDANSHFKTADCFLVCINWCFSCALTALAVGLGVTTIICLAAGLETIGLACLAGLGATAIATLVAGLFGSQAAGGCPSCAASAAAEGITEVLNAQQKDYLVESSLTALMSGWNTSLNALEYEAASAVLTSANGHPQIGNVTFDQPLDLVMSNVASQLAALTSGFGMDLSVIEAAAINVFDVTLGDPSGYSGFGCPFVDGSTIAGALTNGPDNCGQPTTGTAKHPYGLVQGYVHADLFGATKHATFFVQGGSSNAFAISGGGQLTARNNLTGHYSNLSASNYNDTNLSTGNYYFNITGGTSVHLYFSDGIPLDSAAYGATGAQEFLGLAGSPQGDYPVATNGLINVGNGCILIAGSCGGLNPYYLHLGDNLSTAKHIVLYVFTLAHDAATVAQAYWAFLHLLGYFAVSQIPAKCFIPTPNMLIPSNIPPSELASGNVTNYLNLYLTVLAALGYDFLQNLSSLTFCNHKLPPPIGNTSIGFSVFGLGYVFVAGAANNSNGTAPQHFATPTSWNISGQVFLAPSLFPLGQDKVSGAIHTNLGIPVNTTWELPSLNPTFAYVVPLVKDTNVNATKTVANGPTACVTTGHDCSFGSVRAYVVTNLLGNSSNEHGQPYTAAIGNLTTGDAVFFVACYGVSPTSLFNNPVWNKTGACAFNVSTLISPGGTCQYGGLITPSGVVCNGPPPPPPPPPSPSTCGGSTILLGPLVDSIRNSLSGVPVIGVFACPLAWVIGVVFLVVLFIVFVYVVIAIFRAVTAPRQRRTSGNGGR